MNKRATLTAAVSIGFAGLFLIFSPANGAAPHYTTTDIVIRGARDRMEDIQELNRAGYLSYRYVGDFERLQRALIDAARDYRAQPSQRNADRMSGLRSEMRLSFWENKLIANRTMLQKEVVRGRLSRYEAGDLQSELNVIDAIVESERRSKKVVPISVANQIAARFSKYERSLQRARNGRSGR